MLAPRSTPDPICAGLAFAILALAACGGGAPRGSQPPQARREPRVTEIHGERLVDEYGWLRERGAPEVRAYLEAENAYTEAMTAPLAPLREALFAEMKARLQETDQSAPVRIGPYEYYRRTQEGLQYSIHCRRRLEPPGAEEILVDPNALAAGKEYLRVDSVEVSPDHALVAYAIDDAGDERYAIVVKDLATGAIAATIAENASADIAWANDSKTLFTIEQDEAQRPWLVRRHRLGEPGTSAEIFREEDDRFHVTLSKTRSERFIVIDVASAVTSEAHVIDADAPLAAPRLVLPRRQGVEYDVDHRGEQLYLRINDGALDFRVARLPLSALPGTAETALEEVVSHEAGAAIEGVDLFAGHLVVTRRRDALRRLEIHSFATGEWHEVSFDEPLYHADVDENPNFATTTLRYAVESLVTPATYVDYDMNARTKTIVKQDVVPGHDPARYRMERLWAEAPDGARVPVSLVRRADLPEGQPAPCLLYGYGSYGFTIEPRFVSSRMPLIDRGVVFAIAHPRGGGALGRRWYEDGKLLKKQNTFTDFIAAAETLVARGITAPDRLAIKGGSAGGLLVGAVVNQRPELFRAAVAQVPFVDVINTMSDPSIPLTVIEYEEWGNPADPAAFRAMLAYSPYDNVRAQDYPAMLVLAGLNDPRVQYWEPAKWVAKLRATKTDDRPLLLRTNMGAGHGGASGRYDRLLETALEDAFVIEQIGATGATR